MSNSTGQHPGEMMGGPPAGATTLPPTGLSPRIGPTGFTIGIFTVLAISIFTIVSRGVLRLQRTRRLEGDDYFLIAALCFLIGATVTQQYYRDVIYLILSVELGNTPPSAEFVAASPVLASVLDACSVLLWTSIFLIKFSFLFFFRKLLDRVRNLKTYWWVVVGVVVVSALVCIPLGFIECAYFGPDFLAHCPVDELIRKEHIYLNTTIVLDIFTDVLIISLPVALLWNVKIARAKKMTLLGIFGLNIVMVIIALIRVALAPLTPQIIDTSWLFFWQIMEASIALLMVSVSAFRGLFGQSRHHPAYGSGRYRTPTSKNGGSNPKESAGSESVNATGPNVKPLISSPRSPKTLTSFTPERDHPDLELIENSINTPGACEPAFPKEDYISIEMKAISPTPPYSRSESQTRGYSPTGSSGSKQQPTMAERQKKLPPSPPETGLHGVDGMGSSNTGTTVSAHAWSDNDALEKNTSNSNSRREMSRTVWSDRIPSRNTSQTDRRNASREPSASRTITRAPSQGELLIEKKEREAKDYSKSRSKILVGTKEHDRSRNGSNSTTTAAVGHEKMNPEEWV